MKKSDGLKLQDVAIAVLINAIATLIANVVYSILQNPSSFTFLQLPIPMWILVLSIGTFLTIIYLIILRSKVDPLIRKTNPSSKLADNLNDCIKDFSKFFRHPHYAIIPNPFANEPEIWKYYENSFSYVLYSWFSSFKKRFEDSLVNPKKDVIIQYSEEFTDIVEHYLTYANTFRALTKKYNIPDHIRDQYNKKFVGEFNTTFRPNFKNYLTNLQKTTDKKIRNEIGMADELKVS